VFWKTQQRKCILSPGRFRGWNEGQCSPKVLRFSMDIKLILVAETIERGVDGMNRAECL
jgi:hypothetical protein